MSDFAHTSGGRDFAVFLVSGVVIAAWAVLPKTVEREIYVPLPETSTVPDGAKGGPVNTSSLVQAGPVALMLKTSGPRTAAAPSPRMAAYPNLWDAVSRVPVKTKLRMLLTVLVSETDPAARADLQAKLLALLKLPDDVLLEVLQHPDLADFNTMLDAVFFGDTELWWIEFQLEKIDVVPVTTTTDRIDVNGTPAFTFDSTAAAQAGPGGPPTSGLKSVTPTSSEPQVSSITVARSMPDAGASTFAEPVSSDVQLSQASMIAPSGDVPPAPPSAAPQPEPSSAPVASYAAAATNAEIANVETQPTTSPDVFDGGNRFEVGTTASEPSIENTPVSETATPSASAPPPADDGANNSPGAPSENANEGPSPGSETP